MSIFPTKILLATDGSREANLAARTAVDLADKTGSELHVAFVLRTQDAPD
jgi:nucleotide-binding universal stress UspA family protein